MSAKSVQNIAFLLLHAVCKSTLKVPLIFLKIEKNKHEIFNFVHLSSSFFLSFLPTHNLKSVRCTQTLHTKWLLYYKASFSGLGQRKSYDWQAMAWKQCPRTHHVLVWTLLGLLFTNSRHGTYSQATPRLLNVCVKVAMSLLAINCE